MGKKFVLSMETTIIFFNGGLVVLTMTTYITSPSMMRSQYNYAQKTLDGIDLEKFSHMEEPIGLEKEALIRKCTASLPTSLLFVVFDHEPPENCASPGRQCHFPNGW